MGKTLEEVEAETELATAEVTLEEKKAIIAQYKARYGSDWRRMLQKAMATVNNGGKSFIPDVRFKAY